MSWREFARIAAEFSVIADHCAAVGIRLLFSDRHRHHTKAAEPAPSREARRDVGAAVCGGRTGTGENPAARRLRVGDAFTGQVAGVQDSGGEGGGATRFDGDARIVSRAAPAPGGSPGPESAGRGSLGPHRRRPDKPAAINAGRCCRGHDLPAGSSQFHGMSAGYSRGERGC